MAVVKVELDISLLTVSNPILTGRGAKKPHQWIIEQIKDNVCVMCANTTTIDRMNQREKNARTHTNYRSTFKLIQRDIFWPVNSCKRTKCQVLYFSSDNVYLQLTKRDFYQYPWHEMKNLISIAIQIVYMDVRSNVYVLEWCVCVGVFACTQAKCCSVFDDFARACHYLRWNLDEEIKIFVPNISSYMFNLAETKL